MNVVSIVGMPGAGKSEVARIFEQSGFTRIRFGELTDREIKRQGLAPGAESERQVRESLRREHGMAAYAKLNRPAIDAALRTGDVVIDGLYSWEEYLFLKERYGESFRVVAVWAPPRVRYLRLAQRPVRPFTPEEAARRDRTEIENINKGGPIAMADFLIKNSETLAEMTEETSITIAGITGLPKE